MSSPFPGMDPYLEHRATWPDLHQRLISYISDALAMQIRPKYIARIGERVQLLNSDRSIVPDVMIVREPTETYSAAVPMAELIADEPYTYIALDDTRRVPYLEIAEAATGEVVTLIEVLSPANKVGNEREKYIRKQSELLQTNVNFIEIDLIGYGRSTVLARQYNITEPENWRYIVNVSRAEQRVKLEVYAFSLKQRLPRISVPLRHPDKDVVLDLPSIFRRCYEIGGYDLIVDYHEPPETTLSEEETKWVKQLLNANR